MPAGRWILAVLVLTGLAIAALWTMDRAGPRAWRAERTDVEPAGVAEPSEAPNTAPVPEPEPDVAADTEWRLEVEIRDEDGRPMRGGVYVTNATGDLLSKEETLPPAPLVQTVRGTVDVIVYTDNRVPQHFGNLTPPPTGVRTLVAQVERGPGVQGRLFDDVGAPVTRQRARLMKIVAYALDLPPELTKGTGPWRYAWTRVLAHPKEDGSFRFDGLPPGRCTIQCDPDPFGDRGRETEPLLQLEPVTATVGDTNVRVVCVRAVHVRVRLTEFDTGAELRGRDGVMTWHAEDGEDCVSSGSGSMGTELAMTVRPGAELTVSVKIEGYLPPEPLKVAVNREPGRQEATLAFRRDVGGMAVVELTVLDDEGQPVYPLMVGRPLAGIRREENHDGRYVVRLPAGKHTVWLKSPSDQYMLFTREWVASNLDPSDYADARAYLCTSLDVEVPRDGRVTREVRMQRAAFIWIRQEPAGAFEDVRVLRGETEMKGATFELYEDRGLAAQLEPGTYVVEGRAGGKIVRVEVAARAAEVAEAWLRAEAAK